MATEIDPQSQRSCSAVASPTRRKRFFGGAGGRRRFPCPPLGGVKAWSPRRRQVIFVTIRTYTARDVTVCIIHNSRIYTFMKINLSYMPGTTAATNGYSFCYFSFSRQPFCDSRINKTRRNRFHFVWQLFANKSAPSTLFGFRHPNVDGYSLV